MRKTKGERDKNNEPNSTQKTKDRATQTASKDEGMKSGTPEGYSVPSPFVSPVMLLYL